MITDELKKNFWGRLLTRSNCRKSFFIISH